MPSKEVGGPVNNFLSGGDTSTRQFIPSHPIPSHPITHTTWSAFELATSSVLSAPYNIPLFQKIILKMDMMTIVMMKVSTESNKGGEWKKCLGQLHRS